MTGGQPVAGSVQPADRATVKNTSPFSSERKNNAIRTEDKKMVDSLLRAVTSAVWRSLDLGSKQALYDYSGAGYESINAMLAGKPISGDRQKTKEQINRIRDAINKSPLPADMWLFRGIRIETAKDMFGEVSIRHIQDMIQKEELILNSPFISCGSSVGSGNTERPVQLEIYAPKGTKALYMEPFAMCGDGDKLKWDGNTGQQTFSPEFETLVQCGAVLRPIAVKEVQSAYGKQLLVALEIVGQDPDHGA